MLLIFPESSSGWRVCFCAVGAVPGSELCCISSFLGRVQHSVPMFSKQCAELQDSFFSHFKRPNKKRLSHCIGTSPRQQKHFTATSYKKLDSQAGLQTPGLFSAHRGVCLLVILHILKPVSIAKMQGSRKRNS